MSNTPFPVDPVLTAIAIAWRNDRYIADDVDRDCHCLAQ